MTEGPSNIDENSPAEIHGYPVDAEWLEAYESYMDPAPADPSMILDPDWFLPEAETIQATAPVVTHPALEWMAAWAFWIVLWLLPLVAMVLLVSYCISLPMRRRERARFFLDLVEAGLNQGRGVAESVTAISQTRDPDPGVRAHLVAEHIRSGHSLGEALARTPGFLPPQITAMLKVGGEIGDIGKVLPACRGFLDDAISKTRSAFDYLVVMMLVLLPVVPMIFFLIQFSVVPKFEEIFENMLGTGFPAPFAVSLGMWVSLVQLFLALLLYVAAAFYIGGPRFSSWLQAGFLPVLDRVAFWFPWRKKRIQRDFSMMLALLLDAEVPESRAVALAADSTANRVFAARANRVAEDLRAGRTLPEALERLDDSGEFRWRLENASRANAGFVKALSGWFESLDARAFQQEQSASQTFTTGLVILNGIVVGLLVVSVFQLLVILVNEAVLW